ncbi:hypothetical protein [Tropicibacter oceani]|uniref:Uncharacterized protein n=1 Tax=Tropicibacter oceani TaxID=3058420 RepID=A0ABY8QJJ8_9RHOB|nr:hypothetical protein [Tropicibacter oceani]WGW04201.1 hypothetical protein QF118_01300 [Tropicibacter oceani]
MKSLALALALSIGASAAIAGVPTMTLPDLTFPPAQPDVSTQGCLPTQGGVSPCK